MIIMIMTDKDTVNFWQLFHFARRIQMSFFSNMIHNSFIENGIDDNAGIRVDGKQDTGMSKPIGSYFIGIGFELFLWDSLYRIDIL